MKSTPQQENIIKSDAKNILVSAAAGSGKTSVMTRRIADRIVNGKSDARNILVMTFTDAAAMNMRIKIEKELKKQLYEITDPSVKRRISSQILFLRQSQISTIHSFCLDVIKNFYHELAEDEGGAVIEPGFRVADPEEADMLLKKTLDKIFTSKYEYCDDNPDIESSFLQLTDSYGTCRTDEPVKEMILGFYRFLTSMPDYSGWIDNTKREIKESIEDFEKSAWFSSAIEGLNIRLENAKEGLEKLKGFLNSDIKIYKSENKNAMTKDAFREFAAYIEELDYIIKTGEFSWDKLIEYFKKMPELPSIRRGKEEETERRDFFNLFTGHFTELIFYTTGKFGTNSYIKDFNFDKIYIFTKTKQEIQNELGHMYPAVCEMFSVIQELDKSFSENKKERNIIDFSDFEHMALKLLEKNPVKDYYKTRYRETYIDEYQDTSSIQEAIIENLSPDKCFMVGDVKQSIYKFRHANPEIFLGKYFDFRKRDKYSDNEYAVYELNRNFRSVKGILEGVNNVFYQIMSPEAGEIEYSKEQALTFHRQNQDNIPGITVMLTDIDTNGESGKDISADEAEANNIAVCVKKLIDENNIKPGEIAVLARTRSSCKNFSKALTSAGIPNEHEGDTMFLETYELKVLESYIHLLDNPLQDIHLVCVLTSPLVKNRIKEEELLEIRNHYGNTGFFHQCVNYYMDNGPDGELREKLREFFCGFNITRKSLEFRELSNILEDVYYNSGLYLYTISVNRNRENFNTAENFIEWIRATEKTRHSGVYGIAGMMDEIKEKIPGKSPYSIEKSTTDSVKVMTIHKSKGLEFSHVFIAGTHKKMQTGKGRGPVIFSENMGVSYEYVNLMDQYKFPTIPFYLMKEKIKRSDIAEEIRLLYVAMTRAMDRLYISGVISSADIKSEKGIAGTIKRAQGYDENKAFPAHFVLSAKCPLEWILMSVSRNKKSGIFDVGLSDKTKTKNSKYDFYSRCWNVETIKISEHFMDESKAKKKEVLNKEKNIDDEIRRKYFFKYQYPDASLIPLKTTVSELKRNYIPGEKNRNEEKYDDFVRGINITLNKPDEKTGKTLTPSQKGIAFHSFFRYADPEKVYNSPDEKTISDNIDIIYENNIIDSYEHEELKRNAHGLLKYYSSETARRIYRSYRQNKNNIFREMPFTLALKTKDLYLDKKTDKNDLIFVQGIIDLWFMESGEAVLLDYKTDKIPGDFKTVERELRKRYLKQMQIYAIAIEKTENVKVKECIIWHFESGKPYEIKLEI